VAFSKRKKEKKQGRAMLLCRIAFSSMPIWADPIACALSTLSVTRTAQYYFLTGDHENDIRLNHLGEFGILPTKLSCQLSSLEVEYWVLLHLMRSLFLSGASGKQFLGSAYKALKPFYIVQWHYTKRGAQTGTSRSSP
jgi:hypothetical protein